MMLKEQQFSNTSRYHKEPSASSSSIDEVEAYAKANGIIDLDNPEVKKKTILDDLSNYELARHEAKKEREEREAAAQENYQKALGNLETGAADHRIKHTRNQTAKSAKSPKLANKKSTPSKRNARKSLSSRDIIARDRRKTLADRLKAGEHIPLIKYNSHSAGEYQLQQSDITAITVNDGIKIVRISSIKTGYSYFVIDNYRRYQTDKTSGRIVHKNNHDLLKALCSRQLVQAIDLIDSNKDASTAMVVLAHEYSFDIYTVFYRNRVIGWILNENQDEGFDEIKERQGLLLAAAYEKFKSVAQDFDTTISEILAIRDGQ